MKQNVYCAFDEKAEAYLRPFIFTTDGQASRAFSDGVTDKSSPLHKHYQDYSLYCVGTFEERTGELAAIKPVRLVCRAYEFIDPSVEAMSVRVNNKEENGNGSV